MNSYKFEFLYPAWDAVKLTLKVGFICPFVVDDPTDLGATIVVAQALCLSIFNLSPLQKNCLFTDGIKLTCLSVWPLPFLLVHKPNINLWILFSLLF